MRERPSFRAAAMLSLAAVVVVAAVAVRDATTKVVAQRPLEPAAARGRSIGDTLSLPGRLSAESTVKVGSSQPGRVVSVTARVGARTRKGQVLARLDEVEQRAALAEADARLSAAQVLGMRAERQLHAEIDAQRRQGLLPEPPEMDELLEGSAGDAQLEYFYDAAQIERHEASVSLARKRLALRVVRAPLDGIVLARSIEPGESIPASPPGPPLFVLGSDPARLRLEVEIEERHLNAVLPGPATFVVPARGSRVFSGTVRQVVPLPNAVRSPATYVVVLDVANSDGALQPGMSATVALTLRPGHEARSIPQLVSR